MHNQAQPLNTSSTKEEKKMPYSIGSALREKVDPSNALLKQRSKRRIIRGLLIAMLLLLLLSGCGNDYSSIPTIEGRNLEDSSRAIDEQHKQQIVLEQSEKYIRHYQNGLYFEDLSKEQKELNDLFNRHIRQEIDSYIEAEKLALYGIPYIIQTEVEYVNQDVKDYAEGKKKAEDIIDNPNSMMKVKIYWFLFEDFVENKELYSLREDGIYIFIEKKLGPKYTGHRVEYTDIRVKAYDPSVLKKYSMEELSKNQTLTTLLRSEKSTMDIRYCDTYFSYDYENFGEHRAIGRLNEENEKNSISILKQLKEKYNIEFEVELGGYYKPIDYKGVFFNLIVMDGENGKYLHDHFQSAMFQYLANQRVRKIIDDAGLSDRVVFLVTAEPETAQGGELDVAKNPYDFGEGFDEEFFLKKGYEGQCDITLIYLEDESKKEGLNKDQRREYGYQNLGHLIEKIAAPLHEQIHLGFSTEDIYGLGLVGAKETHMYHYFVSDYDRKVIIDLFKKYPLTECEWNPQTSTLADVFSLQYRSRAETPGFHYLDVFGGEEIEDHFDAHYMEDIYPNRDNNQ